MNPQHVSFAVLYTYCILITVIAILTTLIGAQLVWKLF